MSEWAVRWPANLPREGLPEAIEEFDQREHAARKTAADWAPGGTKLLRREGPGEEWRPAT